jgi:protease-4
LFGFWGNNLGASFDWTSRRDGYDKSEWSFVNSEFTSSRSFYFGSRFSATRISEENGTAFSWAPGFIWRPLSFVSLGFWSQYAFQYGFYQNRMQHAGLSIRPFNGITASWNASVKNYKQLKHFSSQTEQNLLLELEALGLTMGIEFPLVEPDKNGEFRFAISAELGSYMNPSFTVDEDYQLKKFSLITHTALNQRSVKGVKMIRVPLGSISEKSSGWSILGTQDYDLETLRNTFSLLEKSDAKAVLFDFSNYSGGFSISQEIRRGIYSLRSKGKRVAAYTNDYRASVIFAASAAEKVILQPSAFVDFKGFANEILYYKGLLDWAGVKVEMIRHGSYKSAMEPYVLDSMSSEAKENLQSVLDGWWRVVRDTLAASRNLSPEFLDSIAKNPRVTASAAKNNRIADTLLYLEDVPKYMSYDDYENWPLSNEKLISNSWAPRSKIAVLNIDGTIVGGYGSNDPLFGKSVTGVADLIDMLQGISYSGEYEALILRINSPGGSAVASDELWNSIRALKEGGIPVIASVGDMAASGAYYAACAADKIVAEAGSVVGSIGIYGGKINLSGLLEKLKINAEVVKTHESANSKSIATGLSESEREALQEYMDEFYNRFTDVVVNGRGILKETMDSLGGGKVFIGMDAIGKGLIDEVGGFERSVEIAKESAGLRKNARVELVHINNYGYSFTDRISAMAKGKSQIYPWRSELEKTQVWAIY